MISFESLELPDGPFKMVEVYFDHDGPRLFAMKSRRWLVNWIGNCVAEDDEKGTVTYLFLRLELPRFTAVRAGAFGLREAFTEAEDADVYQVTWTFPEIDDENEDASIGQITNEIKALRVDEIPENWLPLSGARLNLPTASSEKYEVDEITEISRSTLRTVAALEFEQESRNLTEFPLRGLGKIGAALQDVVDATAQEIAGTRTARGVIPRQITDEVRMSVIGLRAASFVILVGVDQEKLIEDSFVGPVFEGLISFVDAGSSTDNQQLLGVLRDYGPRARGHFQSLLKSLADYGTGFGLEVATGASGEVRAARMSAADTRRSLAVIGSVKPTHEILVLERASLTALNLTRETFELSDGATDRRYPGTVSSAARLQVDGLTVSAHSYVTAKLEVEVDYAAKDDTSGRKYALIDISPL